ncbi:hypothetical protein GOODEAATRI_033847, partial [Goodea atripinnis]
EFLASVLRIQCCLRGSSALGWHRCWWSSVWTSSERGAWMRRVFFECRVRLTLSKSFRRLLTVEKSLYLIG